MKTAIVAALAIVLASSGSAWAFHWPRLLKRKSKPAAAARPAARPRGRTGPAWTGAAGFAALLTQANAKTARRKERKVDRGRAAPTALASER